MMRTRSLSLLLAVGTALLALGLFCSIAAAPGGGAGRNRAGKGPGGERQRIIREIARIRSLLADHRRLNPRGGDLLRAPLKAVAELWQRHGIQPSPSAAERLGLPLSGGQILVNLTVAQGRQPEVRDGLRALGVEEVRAGSEGETMRARVLVPELQRLAGLEGVVSLTATRPLQLATVSEGVMTTWANLWQGYTPLPGMPLGRTVKVAIVDGGFAGYEDLLGTELPDAVDAAAFCGAAGGDVHGCDPLAPVAHGTAVAEILHDMSPDARILLIAINLDEDPSRPGGTFQQALDFASSSGADIVSTSLGTIWDNRDGRSPLCASAKSLAQRHKLWATSAGNQGDPCQHEHYRFTRSAFSGGAPFGAFQSFPKNGDPILDEIVLQPGQIHFVALTWNAWGRAPSDDFDLFYFCDTGSGYSLAAGSADSQCGTPGSVPFEAVGVVNNTGAPLPCAYAVVEYDPQHCPHPADGVQFDAWTELDDPSGNPVCAPMEESTPSYTIAHPADCPDTLAAGAVCVHDGQVEPYSSQGPALDGRAKPDFCAPDAVSTRTYGPSQGCPALAGTEVSGFPGTSASAPHLAGALALLYEKIGGSFTPEQCRAILENRARDINGDGRKDNVCGRGRLCLSGTGCD